MTHAPAPDEHRSGEQAHTSNRPTGAHVEVFRTAYREATGRQSSRPDAYRWIARGWTQDHLDAVTRLARHALQAEAPIMQFYIDFDEVLMSMVAGVTPIHERRGPNQRLSGGLFDVAARVGRAYDLKNQVSRFRLTPAATLDAALNWTTVLVAEPTAAGCRDLAFSGANTGMPPEWLRPLPHLAPWAWAAGLSAEEAAALPAETDVPTLLGMAALRGCHFPHLRNSHLSAPENDRRADD